MNLASLFVLFVDFLPSLNNKNFVCLIISKKWICVVKVSSDCILTLLLGAFIFPFSVFAVKFLFLPNFLFVFPSRGLFNGSSRWRCNEAWHYVIQLVVRLCNDCFKLKYLFLLYRHLVDNQVKNVDNLGSEHHVRTLINEPPGINCSQAKFVAIILHPRSVLWIFFWHF